MQMDEEAVQRHNRLHHCTDQVPSYFVKQEEKSAFSNHTLAVAQMYYRVQVSQGTQAKNRLQVVYKVSQGTQTDNKVRVSLIKRNIGPRP